MRKVAALLMVAAMFMGCARQYCDYFAYDDEGIAKPVVAVLPVRDSSWNSMPWDVSRELEEGIWESARRRGKLYCVDPHHVDEVVASFGEETDLHSQDLQFFNQFTGCDYLVLIDLLEHNEVPYQRGAIEPLYIIDSDDAFVLAMKARVTVLDVTGPTPRVILREITASNHMIARRFYDIDYTENRWGSQEYHRTPVGVAHERLARDLTERIETITAAAALR